MNLKINDMEWHICKETPEAIRKQALVEDKNIVYFGLTDYEILTIFISDAISYDLAISTVLHELVHAFLFSYGMRPEIYTEEYMCEFIAHNAGVLINLQNVIINNLFKNDNEAFRKSIQTSKTKRGRK